MFVAGKKVYDSRYDGSLVVTDSFVSQSYPYEVQIVDSKSHEENRAISQ